jgi:hypothetical protein
VLQITINKLSFEHKIFDLTKIKEVGVTINNSTSAPAYLFMQVTLTLAIYISKTANMWDSAAAKT